MILAFNPKNKHINHRLWRQHVLIYVSCKREEDLQAMLQLSYVGIHEYLLLQLRLWSVNILVSRAMAIFIYLEHGCMYPLMSLNTIVCVPFRTLKKTWHGRRISSVMVARVPRERERESCQKKWIPPPPLWHYWTCHQQGNTPICLSNYLLVTGGRTSILGRRVCHLVPLTTKYAMMKTYFIIFHVAPLWRMMDWHPITP